MPDEIIAEVLSHLPLIDLWLGKTVCKKFSEVINGVILRGALGANMRKFNTHDRYCAAIATGRIEIFDIVMKSAEGLYADIIPEGAMQHAAKTSLVMVKRLRTLGYPIIFKDATGCLENLEHEEAIGVFEWIEEHCGYAIPESNDARVCAHAARSGNLDTMRYIKNRGYPISAKVWKRAFEHEMVMEWCLLEGVPMDVYTLKYAAIQGTPQLMQRLFDEGFHYKPPTGFEHTMAAAVESGSTETINIVMKYTPALLTTNLMVSAARLGHSLMLQYMLDENVPYTAHVAQAAATHGHVDVLQLLFSRRLLTPDTCPPDFWVNCNHLSVIKWALAAEFSPRAQDILRVLAASEDLTAFRTALDKYSAEITTENTELLYDYAMRRCRLDNMKAIHRLGHPIPPFGVLYWPSHVDDIACIEWLYGQIDPTIYDVSSSEHIDALLIAGNLTALKFLHYTGKIDVLQLTANQIGECVYNSILRWLVSLGKTFTADEFSLAMQLGQEPDAVIFIHEHAEFNRDDLTFIKPCVNGALGVCQQAAHHEDLDMLKWAHSVGYPLSAEVIGFAAADRNTEIVKWAVAHDCPLGPWSVSITDTNVIVRNTETAPAVQIVCTK